MSTNIGPSGRARALAIIEEQLDMAASARKCHGCGCFRKTVEALSKPGIRELEPTLDRASRVLGTTEYDCLGCSTCYPAIASNAFSDAFPDESAYLDHCPADTPSERPGWPPLPGDYRVLRFRAPVAVCTLNDDDLAAVLASAAPEQVSIVGTLHTENLGIERIVRNTLANPHIRHLVLCGEDTKQVIGHLPGQSLLSLAGNGVDEAGRIIGAKGKRPILKNLRREHWEAFRSQVEVVDLIGETRAPRVLERVAALADRSVGTFEDTPGDDLLERVLAKEPQRLIPDPAGFFVVYPDTARRLLTLEHYDSAGVLDAIMEGATPAALYTTAIERKLISRLDHAAYLGRELARAERSLETGEPYVQDRAPGELESESQMAGSGCSAGYNPSGIR